MKSKKIVDALDCYAKGEVALYEERIARFLSEYTEKKTYGDRGKHMAPVLCVGNQSFEIGRMRDELVTGEKEDEEYVAFMRRQLAIALMHVVSNEVVVALREMNVHADKYPARGEKKS